MHERVQNDPLFLQQWPEFSPDRIWLRLVLRRRSYVSLRKWCNSLDEGVAGFFFCGVIGCRCSGSRRGTLVEGPDLQAVDVEVLPGGERLVAKCSAPVGGAAVQFGVQPQTKVPAAEKRW